MKWFARRFKHTRNLERQVRKVTYELDGAISTIDVLEALLRDCQERRMNLGKATLTEVESLLTVTVDYHKALASLAAADPIQHRVLPIFEKYNIKVIRNTRGDVPKRVRNANMKISGVT